VCVAHIARAIARNRACRVRGSPGERVMERERAQQGGSEGVRE
jgi:hypothetical protein